MMKHSLNRYIRLGGDKAKMSLTSEVKPKMPRSIARITLTSNRAGTYTFFDFFLSPSSTSF